jgi:hypothetical protein
MGSGTITPITTVSNLDYLIPVLRLKLGDTTPATYRYLDAWLSVSLIAAIKSLSRWWNFRYLVDASNVITRNADNDFTIDESFGLIQKSDEWPIVLMAAILIKDGSLQNSAWDIGSWRDAEISYSNIQSGVLKDASIKRDWEELMYYVMPPTKHLVTGSRAYIATEYVGG